MLKIATWNVNSVNARVDRLVAFLRSERPDVLCLQELKCEESRFPFDVVRECGYFAAVHGQRTYNGVAILAREMPAEVVSGFGDGGDDAQARCLSARVAGVRVLSVYIPNGQAVGTDKYAYKLEWLSRFRQYLDRTASPSDWMVVGGDFNVAPEDQDVHDPELWRGRILFSEPEKQALANVVGFGLRDTFRLHHPTGKHFSWWDYRQLAFPKDRGLRIDFLLATAPLAERCLSARIFREERKGSKPSDHVPVMAEFDIGG